MSNFTRETYTVDGVKTVVQAIGRGEPLSVRRMLDTPRMPPNCSSAVSIACIGESGMV